MELFRILSSTDKLGIQRIDTSSPEPDALGELRASPALSSEKQGHQKSQLGRLVTEKNIRLLFVVISLLKILYTVV